MPSNELAVNRRQTVKYIQANPTTLTLNRSILVDDGAGGKVKSAPVAQESQVVRIIQSSESDGTERRTVDGENVRPQLNLLAEHDANIQVGDTFTWRGNRCEIVYITDMGYELICEVSLR